LVALISAETVFSFNFMHDAGRGKFEEKHVTGCRNDVRNVIVRDSEYPGLVVYESHASMLFAGRSMHGPRTGSLQLQLDKMRVVL